MLLAFVTFVNDAVSILVSFGQFWNILLALVSFVNTGVSMLVNPVHPLNI